MNSISCNGLEILGKEITLMLIETQTFPAAPSMFLHMALSHSSLWLCNIQDIF